MMAPFLFSVDRNTFIDLSMAAERGDEGALQALRDLWGTGRAEDIECFLCTTRCEERPIAGLIFPDLHDPETLLGALLCPSCSTLPAHDRWSRCLKVLEAMDHLTVH